MALSKKQRRALRAAKKDDKITKKESKQLKALGIPKRQAQVTASSGNKGKIKTSDQPRSEDKNRNKNKTEPPVLSAKQLNKLRTEIELNDGAVRNTTFSRRPGDNSEEVPGSINYTAYGGKNPNALGQNQVTGKNAKI